MHCTYCYLNFLRAPRNSGKYKYTACEASGLRRVLVAQFRVRQVTASHKSTRVAATPGRNPSTAGRRAAPLPSAQTHARLPLATVLAKLQNDPFAFLGWEVLLLRANSQRSKEGIDIGGSPSSVPSSGPGKPARTEDSAGGSLALRGHHERLGCVVEVLPSPEASSPGASRRSNRNSRLNGDAEEGRQQRQQRPFLRVVRSAQLPSHSFEGTEEFFVQLDNAVVPYGDVSARVLLVDPPEDLLQQGRRALTLQLLRRELQAFWQESTPPPPSSPSSSSTSASSPESCATDSHVSGAASSAPESPPTRSSSGGIGPSSASTAPAAAGTRTPRPVMPSRGQLEEAGRGDLVGLVEVAGGFREVARRLGRRGGGRRPAGYWSGPGSWERLREEVAAFVGTSWVELPHPDVQGRSYYYNQISNRTAWRPPVPIDRLGSSSSSSFCSSLSSPGGAAGGGGGLQWAAVETAADRVMPSQSAVLRANRRDLDYAIRAHGGYVAVAQRLGRRITWALSTRVYGTPSSLRRKLRAVAASLGLPSGVWPTHAQLQQYGDSLVAAVRRCGGLQALMGAPRRRSRGTRQPVGHWDDVATLAAELAKFANSAAGISSVSGSSGNCSGDIQTAADCVSSPKGPMLPEAPSTASPQAPSSALASAPQPSPFCRRAATPSRSPAASSTPCLPPPSPAAEAAAEATMEAIVEAIVEAEAEASAAPAATPSPRLLPSPPSQAAPMAAAMPPPTLPTRKQLEAAGRHDLWYGLTRHSRLRNQVAELGGLRQLSRRGTNRNALSFEAVARAIQAGCHTPKAIREHLQGQGKQPQEQVQQQRGQLTSDGVGGGDGGSGISVSRQHLTSYLGQQVAEGRLVKLSYGRYGLPP